MEQIVDGQDISFERDGDEIKAYLARPEGNASMPGLVIIPDVHGLSDHYRDIARRFAAEGCVALALDLYSREGAPKLGDLEAINRWIAQLPDERILGDIAGAVRYLDALPEVRAHSVAITGFCMGGQYAIMAACTIDGIAAAVSWYGMVRYEETNDLKPASPLDLAPDLRCPYLGMFGAEDPIIPVADVEALRDVLKREGKDAEIEIYEGAGHAFFNDTRPEMYRPKVAATAWPRALEFFRKHLQ